MVYNSACRSLQLAIDEGKTEPGAYSALALLLAINLFNYIDRQVLAAARTRYPRHLFLRLTIRTPLTKMGLLADAFSRHLHDQCSPARMGGRSILALDDRRLRDHVWSLATGATGFAGQLWRFVSYARFWSGSARVVMARPHRPFWRTFFQSKSAGGFSHSFVQPSRSEAHWVTF
jgi:hypothetical protein